MQKLDPKSVWLFFFPRLVGVFPVVIFGSVFLGPSALELFGSLIGSLVFVLVFIVICLIGVWVWSKLYYHFYRYEMHESGFRKESGIIAKRYVTIPYEKIQNVDINRSFLARILGLSSLNIQTAGASAIGAEGSLPGITHEVAEQLRNELVRRSQQRRAAQGGV